MGLVQYLQAQGFIYCEKIAYGWSEDTKYVVGDASGNKRLLRVSAQSKLIQKASEFAFVQHCNTLPIPMSQAISLYVDDQIYMLLSYVEGERLECVLPSLSKAEAYDLGIVSGSALHQLHQLSLPQTMSKPNYDPQALRNKVLSRLNAYEATRFDLAHQQELLALVRRNIDQLYQRDPCMIHGDYHCGNLIYQKDHTLAIIDFNRFDYSDPYEEFARLDMFDVPANPSYAKGLLHGYFQGEPPMGFWAFYAVYMAYISLHSIVWAIPYGQAEVDGFIKRYHQICEQFLNFTSKLPDWYLIA